MIPRHLIDTSTLSEVIKGRNPTVVQQAQQYLQVHQQFSFSILTRYEILRGLEAKGAQRQLAQFNQQCAQSEVLALTDAIVVQASQIYAQLYQSGQLISDADILIAATALHHGLPLITENVRHFQRIAGLTVVKWS